LQGGKILRKHGGKEGSSRRIRHLGEIQRANQWGNVPKEGERFSFLKKKKKKRERKGEKFFSKRCMEEKPGSNYEERKS